MRRGSGSQCTSGGLGKATSVLGIKAERIRVSTPQQNGHAGSSRNTPRRGCIRTRDLESFQDAEARPPQAHGDYNASRVHSSIGLGRRPASSSGSGKETIGGGRSPMAMAAIGAKTLPKYAPK